MRLIQRMGLPFIAAADRMMTRRMKTCPIPGSATGLILYRIIPYRGQATTTSDGVLVQPGDPIADFHFSNAIILGGRVNGQKMRSEMEFIPLIRQELEAISMAVYAHKIPPVKAAYSLSLFGPFVKRIGFDIIPAPITPAVKRQILWMRILRYFFSPDYSKTQDKHNQQKPVYHVWFSQEKMIKLAQSRLEHESNHVINKAED